MILIGLKLDSGEDSLLSATLPYFVSVPSILTQLMVCQEKNTILQFFFKIFSSRVSWNHDVIMEFARNCALQTNSALFYSWKITARRLVKAIARRWRGVLDKDYALARLLFCVKPTEKEFMASANQL